MIFSPGNSDLKREIQGLRSDVSELRKLIEKQTSEIQQLREGLGKDK
jgi:hypothetical protein